MTANSIVKIHGSATSVKIFAGVKDAKNQIN